MKTFSCAEPVYVTRPLLPEVSDLMTELEDVFASRILTNMGPKHNALETKLKDVLKVPHVSLFNNGTIALLLALKSFDFPEGGEVITTPFTFAATPHCISWNGLKPVFCDIDPQTMCIDPRKIEALVTEKTCAILGVHVYGFPCDVEAIDTIAQKHGLRVIYDAAHAFSTEIRGKGIGSYGDMTMFSFHATKLFHSIEGGCLTYQNPLLERKIYNLRNFGIRSEELVEEVGINGKMNEFQAAVGLLNLKRFEAEKVRRMKLKAFYDEQFSNTLGITVPQMPPDVSHSCQYFPVIVEETYPLSRDMLYNTLKEHNIFSRKYFYPLCSDFDCYKNLPSAQPEHLPVATIRKKQVLCLPFYGDLEEQAREVIVRVICSKNG